MMTEPQLDVPDIETALADLLQIVPPGPVGEDLICGCQNCISADALERLNTTPFQRLTPRDLTLHFSADFAGDGGAEAALSATRLLAVWLRDYAAVPAIDAKWSYHLSFDYPLGLRVVRTDIASCTDPAVDAAFCKVFANLLAQATRQDRPRITDLVLLMASTTRGFPDVLREVTAKPAIRLKFLAAFAQPLIADRGRGLAGAWSDLFHHVPSQGYSALAALITAPDMLRLVERAVFWARDPDWAAYLSQLQSWLDAEKARFDLV